MLSPFEQAVLTMREKQREYFRTRDEQVKRDAIILERRVDRILEELTGQRRLFDSEPIKTL